MNTKMMEQFSVMDNEMLACVEGGDNSYGFWYRIGGLVRDGFDLYVENQKEDCMRLKLCTKTPGNWDTRLRHVGRIVKHPNQI